ncbi:MAG TPA: hypothetical protein VD994_08500 [Prosthecobacter sp.]|nr:hypothetical protein [Prosthecobacter sp.]
MDTKTDDFDMDVIDKFTLSLWTKVGKVVWPSQPPCTCGTDVLMIDHDEKCACFHWCFGVLAYTITKHRLLKGVGDGSIGDRVEAAVFLLRDLRKRVATQSPPTIARPSM